MRQRYYNTEIKRFVNQDILTGSVAGSQSLNRYSYVQGNPVSYTDPFGLSPLNGLFSGSNVRHALLGLASCIPVIGFVASAADAWFYYREGNTAMAAACTVDAVIGLFGVTGSLLQMASKTRRVGKAIQIAAKIGNGGVGLYRNATTFGKSAVDFYMRHEGTFFTKDFRWELADAGDFLSMAVSGLGATTSAAGMASGISDAAKTYRQWQETDALKNSIRQNAMGTKGATNGVGDLPGCFIAGTPVKTADGDRIIEEVSVGDEVLSYDVYTGEFGYKKVRQVYVHEATELAHVQVDNETITATTNHPFYVVGYGFLEAGRLQAGDKILLASGEVKEVEGIVIEHLEEPVRVYNFEVEDWHTYFVGEKGILVHNMCNVTRSAGEGGSNTTAGSGFKWGNPKSTPTYGHTFSQHGQKQTLQQLIDRANGFDNPHQVGQWLNDQQAADFLADAVKNKGGSFDISLLSDINARVVLPNGTTVKPDMVRVIMKPDGSIRTAYPFSSLFPTN